MIIRQATSKDLNKISDLEIELTRYEKRFDPLVRIDSKKNMGKWVKRNFQNKNSIYFIAIDNNEITGYVQGRLVKKSRHYLINKFGYFDDCFVLPNYRKKGVGKALSKKLFSWFRSKGIKYVELDVFSKNESALKFWQSLGFKEIEKKMRIKL